MDKCVLVKSDLSFESDIQAFRREMLDANSSMDGTGPLRRMDNIKDFNEFLEKYGGHIGYSVRPSERRKGYARMMLADCLKNCKAYGLEKVLLTCIQGNEGSRRTILANGGVYESTVYCEPDDVYLERYWIRV